MTMLDKLRAMGRARMTRQDKERDDVRTLHDALTKPAVPRPHSGRVWPPAQRVRRSTLTRIYRQAMAGLSPLRREVVMSDGSILHPTNGRKGPGTEHGPMATTPPAAATKSARDFDRWRKWLVINFFPGYRDGGVVVNVVDAKINKLTNWQRRLWQRRGRKRDVKELDLILSTTYGSRWQLYDKVL